MDCTETGTVVKKIELETVVRPYGIRKPFDCRFFSVYTNLPLIFDKTNRLLRSLLTNCVPNTKILCLVVHYTAVIGAKLENLAPQLND